MLNTHCSYRQHLPVAMGVFRFDISRDTPKSFALWVVHVGVSASSSRNVGCLQLPFSLSFSSHLLAGPQVFSLRLEPRGTLFPARRGEVKGTPFFHLHSRWNHRTLPSGCFCQLQLRQDPHKAKNELSPARHPNKRKQVGVGVGWNSNN